MGLDLSAYDSMLKDDYGPKVVSLINKRVKLLDMFTKNGDTSLAADGRQVLYPIHTSRNTGAGAVGENKTLPVAGNQGTSQVKIPYRYNYGRIQLTTQTIKASKTNKGAFKKAMEFEMKGMVNDLARQRNRQLWGFGVGILCRVNAGQGSGTTINVKDPYGVTGTVGAARLIQLGDNIVFVRNATPTSATDSDIVGSTGSRTVSSIASDFSSVTFDAATGATLNDNDMFVLSPGDSDTQSSVNKETMGLLGIVDDGTYVGTLFNITRSSTLQYKSTVLTLNGDLSFDVLQRLEDLCDEKGGPINQWHSHHSVRREYIKLLIVAKRFVGDQNMNPDAGIAGAALTDKLTFNEKPWKADRMAPYGTIFGIDSSNAVRYVNCEGEWADDDGTILLRIVDKDVYEGRFRVFDNFHIERPDTCGRIDGVNATVDVTAAE